MTSAGGFVHGTALVIGETGVLITGPSGSGKSSLAQALLLDAVLFGRFGRLVGDDRVALAARHGRLLARPHPALAGLIERRGGGLIALDHEPACVLGLVVALLARGALSPRLPDEPPLHCTHGVALPLLTLAADASAVENSRRVFSALTLTQPVAVEPFQGAC